MVEILGAWAEGKRDGCRYLNLFASQCKGISNDKDFQRLLLPPLFVMCEERRGDSLEMLVVLIPLKSAPLPLSKGRILVQDGAICYVMNSVAELRALI